MKKEGHEFYLKSVPELFEHFQTSEAGLKTGHAEKLLEKYGRNVIQKRKMLKPLKILSQQFNSLLILILIIAGIIMLFLGHKLDSIVIFAIVIINTSLGFAQQYSAEKAILGLRKLLISKTKVLRDNKIIEINSEEIVPGDIIIFAEGDKINADCRIIESENLQTDEAILTGESLPVSKSPKHIYKKTDLAKQENMLFAGTQVVRGNAKALVVATGMKTVFGGIAETLQEIEEQKTPMQKKLDTFSKQLGIIILSLVFIILIFGILKKFNILDMFMTSVALAVGAIPEGLPAVLAIGFSISSVMLSKKNVIIRKLPAVEALGGVTVICSDKTGTITEEKMYVQEIFANNNLYIKQDKKLFIGKKMINVHNSKEVSFLIETSILCNNARYEITNNNYTFIGDPTEQSLLMNAIDLEYDKKSLIEVHPSIQKYEFSSKRRMMSILRANGKNNTLYSKGAPEKIIELSSHEFVNGNIRKLTTSRKNELLKISHGMERDALRVLGFAFRNFSKNETASETNLIFIGFAGMIDPPRKEVKKAIQQCKDSGIKIKIITGDSALTALAIAKQIGITGRIITETELEKMSDSELIEEIDNISVFARTTPHQKLRIIKILQQKKEIVAVTGDGINDVLALKSADIGIAMGIRGTDVARDVSDIILIDDNFASLVEGVKQGRQTYSNIKKFTKYLLSVHFSEIFLIMTTLAFVMPLPLLPLQLLWINLVSDSFPAISIIFEKDNDLMSRKPLKEKGLLDNLWKFILFAGILAFLSEILIYLIGIKRGLDITEVRTMVLTVGLFFELSFIYSCKTMKPFTKSNLFNNKWMNLSILFGVIAHLVLLYTPLAIAFKVVPLSFSDWLFVLPFGISGFVIFEIWKFFRKEKVNKE